MQISEQLPRVYEYKKTNPKISEKKSQKKSQSFEDALEVVFSADPKKRSFAESFSKKRSWSAGVQAQLHRKLKDFKDDEKPAHFQIYFETGGSCLFLFFPSKISTYHLHGFLRDQVGPQIKQFEKLHLNVSALKKESQSKILDAMTSLGVLSQWEPVKTSIKVEKKESTKIHVLVESHLSPQELQSITQSAEVVARSTNLVRTLSDLPSNILTPKAYSEWVQKRSHQKKYKYEFLDRKQLLKLGAGGFLAVTQGGYEDHGGIVHIHHKVAKGKNKKIVLVGKGVCFDTGGYNVKTSHMHGMHKDMTGSAIALSVFEALLELKLPYEIHAYLALAENLISDKAYRPNDVVTTLDGTTIEVADTDAEGRMILSDTLALARKEKADLVLDFATLTGAAVRAIDTRRCAVFSNQEWLLQLAVTAGESSGERTWGFPIGDDYTEQLKSEVADILQCRSEGSGDHIYAASFLQKFIGEETPWVHMDLSAAENKGGLGLVSSYTTGFGVRWSIEFIRRHFERKSRKWL